MTETSPAIDDYSLTKRRYLRLISLTVGAELLVAAIWLGFIASVMSAPTVNPLAGWRIAIPAATLALLLLFAVVTALWDVQQRVRWLVVIAVLLPMSLLLTVVQLVMSGDYRGENLLRLVSWNGPIAQHMTVGLGSVLCIHTLLWPVRAILSWRLQWRDAAPRRREPIFTLWHLIGWVALGATLVMAADSNFMLVFILLAEFGSLLVIFPLLICCTRRNHTLFWILGALGGVIGLSYLEEWITFSVTSAAGAGGGFPVWLLGIWNGVVAGMTLLVVFLLRWNGLEFELPLSLREAASQRQSQAAGLAATSAAREFQFSLRSLLIVTTLLCIGPGAYIGWEREQCRRGGEILARIDKLGGMVEPISQPRPVWLRAILGDNTFRRVTSVKLSKAQVTGDDLAALSGLPNLSALMLDEQQLTDRDLAGLRSLKNLSTVFLAGTKITDEGLAHLSSLTKLSYLSLDDTKVTDAGLVHLSGLTNLTILRLQDTEISDRGLVHLKPLEKLTWLFADNTQIGDVGLAHLPPNLTWLSLSNTKVTDAGLASISRLTQLGNLHLGDDEISDAGLAHLENLEKLTNLMVQNTQVTPAGKSRLNEKLPTLKIYP